MVQVMANAEGKPNYPYVEFKQLKKVWHEETKQRDEVAVTSYVKVSGCHGTPEAMLEFEKQGMIIVGYGHLNQSKYDSLKAHCERRIGNSIHPKLKAALETQEVMNGKIERARSTKTA